MSTEKRIKRVKIFKTPVILKDPTVLIASSNSRTNSLVVQKKKKKSKSKRLTQAKTLMMPKIKKLDTFGRKFKLQIKKKRGQTVQNSTLNLTIHEKRTFRKQLLNVKKTEL